MFRRQGQVIPGNAVTFTELGFETPRTALSQVLSLHVLQLGAIFQRSGLRYGHAGSWESTEHGPMPPLQLFTGQEPLRQALTLGAERRQYVDEASAVAFRPFGSIDLPGMEP